MHSGHHEVDLVHLIFESNLINFAVVLGLTAFMINKFVPKASNGQKSKLETKIQEAIDAKNAAEQRLEELEKAITKAKAESEVIISDAKASAEKLKQDTITEAQKQIDVMDQNARREIEHQKQVAIKEIRETILNASVKLSQEKIQEANRSGELNKKITEKLVSNI